MPGLPQSRTVMSQIVRDGSADPAAAENAVAFVEHNGLAGGDAELGLGESHVQAIAVD